MYNDELIYKYFEDGHEAIVSELVWEVFSEFEAPDYSPEGINTFREFIAPAVLNDRIKNHGFKVYCCFDKELLVGVLALRDTSHISLLFVKKNYHRKGISKSLLSRAIDDIAKLEGSFKELTVNSSPYAVEIYERLGFVATGKMQEMNGIKFTPMKRII